MSEKLTIDQALHVALGYHQAGRLLQAEQIYRQILQSMPKHADALHLLGLIVGQKGRHVEAANMISCAIEVAPNNPAFHCNLGVFLQYQGQLDRAAAAYLRAAELKPDYAEAHGNLGIVLALKGQVDRAIVCYQKSLAIRPDAIDIQQNLGHAWKLKGEFANAIHCYQQVLALDPNYHEARFNIGICLWGAGKLDTAIAVFQEILAANSNDHNAWHSLGNVLEEKGELGQAIDSFRRAILANPDFLEAYCDLADALTQTGDYAEAVSQCEQALTRNPNLAAAHSTLGLALASQGKLDAAIQAYRRAVTLNPNLIEAHCNLANAYCDVREFSLAIESCKTAIGLRPDFADAHFCLANAYLAVVDYHQAITSQLRALSLRPHYPEALNNLGLAYFGLRKFDEAIDSFNRAIEQDPTIASSYGNLGNVLKDSGQVPQAIEAYRSALRVHPRFLVAADNLLYTLIFDPAADAKTIFEAGKEWDQQFAQPLAKFIQPHTNDRKPDRPLRIGYVSPDLYDHPVGRFMLSLICSHDSSNYQVYCYAEARRVDAVTEKMRSHCRGWRDTAGKSDSQVAAMIREDQIDILVDLALHMAKNRLLVFARKPAPVQATFAGYPGSTGLRAIDYRISDPYLDPPEGSDGDMADDIDRFYSEKTIRLPDTFWCDHLISEEPPVSEPPFLRNGYVTFGSLNNFCKVNESVLSLWADVLLSVEKSKLLVLVPDGTARQNLLARLSAFGVDSSRIEFVGHHVRASYLETYHRIDIGLDTWPYNGHATSFDSFWMGVPVVTLVGPTVAGRAGVSQLMNLRLGELIGQSREDFLRIASDLANHPTKLTELRSTLRVRMRISPLMDAPRFARGMESAYRIMWSEWCAR